MLIDQFDTLFGLVPTVVKIESGVSTQELRDSLFEKNGTLKFAKPSREWPHRDAYHVSLRAIPMAAFIQRGYFGGNVLETASTNLYAEYPNLTAWANAFGGRHRGRVERIVIAALKPRSQVYRHADRGYYHAPRDRYHLVLQSKGGSWMCIAGQEAMLREGEVWWINNKAGHESFNDSDELRIHLIVDLYPHSVLRRIRNYLRWIYLGLRPNRLTNYWFNWPKRHQATS